MSKSYEDIVLGYLKNYREVGVEVKNILRRLDPDVEVYVFGSVVRGRYTASSDIDILVVTDDLERKYEMMVEVYKRVEAPIELHIITREKFNGWYRRFIPSDEVVEI
ncbi:MAG: nucleotidyltransferase domain-containing protein [Aigarchaeota archaeon]|nr:nucleotidyltransferase domain-containing protein [Candidatus Pelearchaeum maunauluense]